jgi:probable F420-dependent oxidoreductase
MKIGIATILTEFTMRPVEFAQAVEERGFDALFHADHTHVPTSGRYRFPLGDGSIPIYYAYGFDQMLMLGIFASATRRIKIGTAVNVVVCHDPIILARQVGTIDVLSGGRFILTVGTGWNPEELGNHGTPYKDRWKICRERVEAMKAIWTHDEAEYHGEFVNFDPMLCFPKPVQKPYPPLLLGAQAPRSLQRIVDQYDGWYPPGMPIERFEELHAELMRLAEIKGRDPKSIAITVGRTHPITADAQINLDEEKRAFERYAKAGVERATYRCVGAPRDEMLPALDRLAKLNPA